GVWIVQFRAALLGLGVWIIQFRAALPGLGVWIIRSRAGLLGLLGSRPQRRRQWARRGAVLLPQILRSLGIEGTVLLDSADHVPAVMVHDRGQPAGDPGLGQRSAVQDR